MVFDVIEKWRWWEMKLQKRVQQRVFNLWLPKDLYTCKDIHNNESHDTGVLEDGV